MTHIDDLPFAGLKVVDLSQGVAGPHCGMLLALNGADVVKVEPLEGDWGRAIGRQWGDFSAYNIAFNRGKRSLAVNLKHPEGRSIVERLMHGADVVVENYRPGVLARFGLDYAAVTTHNPALVYTSITGFGQSGPNAGLPATDSILQSYSGLMSVNRDATGMPQRIGVLVIDVVTGLYAFQAVATSLYRRLRGGGGKHVSVSLMESIGAVQAGKMIEFHLEGPVGQAPGVHRGLVQVEGADQRPQVHREERAEERDRVTPRVPERGGQQPSRRNRGEQHGPGKLALVQQPLDERGAR